MATSPGVSGAEEHASVVVDGGALALARPGGAEALRRLYRIVRNVAVAAVAVALTAGAIAIGTRWWTPAFTFPGVASVVALPGGAAVAGASSKVVRTNDDVTVTLTTTGLPDGHVVVLRALIFNEPGSCRHPSAVARCGAEDLSNAEAQPSVVFVSGVAVRASSGSAFKGVLKTGDASRAVLGKGLTNPHGADLQFVLADKGPLAPGMYADMVGSISGGCTDAQPGWGKAGPNTCRDIQAAVHQKP